MGNNIATGFGPTIGAYAIEENFSCLNRQGSLEIDARVVYRLFRNSLSFSTVKQRKNKDANQVENKQNQNELRLITNPQQSYLFPQTALFSNFNHKQFLFYSFLLLCSAESSIQCSNDITQESLPNHVAIAAVAVGHSQAITKCFG